MQTKVTESDLQNKLRGVDKVSKTHRHQAVRN